MKHLYFFYFLITLIISNVSLGMNLFLYSKTRKKRMLYYLYSFVPFTLIVIFHSVIAYIETNIPEMSPDILMAIQYLQTISAISLIFAVPCSIHYFNSVSNINLRNRFFAGLFIVSFISYHIFSFILTESFYGNIGFIHRATLSAVMLYCVVIDVKNHRKVTDPVRKRFERNGTIVFLLFLPGFIYDFIIAEASSFRSYPIFYCCFSIIFTISSYRQYFHLIKGKNGGSETASAAAPIEAFFKDYNISTREQDIIKLVLQGYSNQRIAEVLYISLNTVKAHLRNIFPKFGVHSRFELITYFRDAVIKQ